MPPRDELESVWDPDEEGPPGNDGDDDPAERERREQESPPSSSEMAGDGAVGGDGIDEPGWD